MKGWLVFIRVHGAPAFSIYREARELGFKIVDATCLMAKEMHEIVRQIKERYGVIVIEDSGQDKVPGIMTDFTGGASTLESITYGVIEHIKQLSR